MSRAYLLKFPCHQKHLSYYEASIMAAAKSSHRPPDKRIRNSQPTNLLRATACYFHRILIIGTIRNIVAGERGVGDSSNRINRTRKIDVSETNLKCLSDFFILLTKVATNKTSISTTEYAIKYFFNTFIISLMTSFYKETCDYQ